MKKIIEIITIKEKYNNLKSSIFFPNQINSKATY